MSANMCPHSYRRLQPMLLDDRRHNRCAVLDTQHLPLARTREQSSKWLRLCMCLPRNTRKAPLLDQRLRHCRCKTRWRRPSLRAQGNFCIPWTRWQPGCRNTCQTRNLCKKSNLLLCCIFRPDTVHTLLFQKSIVCSCFTVHTLVRTSCAVCANWARLACCTRVSSCNCGKFSCFTIDT